MVSSHPSPQGYTTARTLLSILRLSEALARLRWADQVSVCICMQKYSVINLSSCLLYLHQVIEDDVNEALRLMKMSKVRLVLKEVVSNIFCADTNQYRLLLQVSLEDTMMDENPKLDPITAVYMVGASISFKMRYNRLSKEFPEKLICILAQAIRDWADGHQTTEVSYDRAVALLVSKGHAREVLDACLEEYASLDVWMLDGEKNITFID